MAQNILCINKAVINKHFWKDLLSDLEVVFITFCIFTAPELKKNPHNRDYFSLDPKYEKKNLGLVEMILNCHITIICLKISTKLLQIMHFDWCKNKKHLYVLSKTCI